MTNPASIFPRRSARQASSPLLGVACVTPEERALAQEVCRGAVLRGLGQASRYPEWDASRWADVEPCDVADLPDCPCVGKDDVIPIGGCLAGTTPEGWPADLHDRWCAQTGAGIMLNGYCPGNPVPPVPDCLTQEHIEGVSYCNRYGFAGPNPLVNALCWAAISSGTLGTYARRPACSAAEPPPSAAPPRQPTTTGPGPTPTPTDDGGEPADDEQGSLMVPGLILLAVVGAGAAYYFSQRK